MSEDPMAEALRLAKEAGFQWVGNEPLRIATHNALVKLIALARAVEQPRRIWVCANKTASAFFWSEESARKMAASGSATLGMQVYSVDLLDAEPPAAPVQATQGDTMFSTFPTIKEITPAVRRAMGNTDASYDDLVQALRLVEHATAPTPDDGGGHEAAHSIATEALSRAAAPVQQEPVGKVNVRPDGTVGIKVWDPAQIDALLKLHGAMLYIRPASDEAMRALRQALHQISLCSVNSASSKEECGRIARAALKETP